MVPAFGFFVEFEAREGKEDDVAQFLADAESLVLNEPDTLAWFAFRLGARTFRIFDAFETEAGRQAHLQGRVREAIEARGDELFASVPLITPVDLIATKLPPTT
jgi:hypothetical protein